MHNSDSDDHPEVCNHRNHQYVPELITANLDDTYQPPITIIVSTFRNGGTVYHFQRREWWSKDLTSPELFIRQMLSHVLSATTLLHASDPLVINNIHPRNIFIDWPSNATFLPEFDLGDFGLAEIYPAGT